MTLVSNNKKLQKKQEKAQAEMATKLVGIADELYKLLEEKELAVYECALVVDLLKKRIDNSAQGWVGQKKLNELK